MSGLDDAIADVDISALDSPLDQAIHEIHTENGSTPPDTWDRLWNKSGSRGGDSLIDLGHEAVSGTAHSAIGGLKGLAVLATTGGDVDKAADAVKSVTDNAYHAPPSVANTVAKSPWNPLNWIQGAADRAADASATAQSNPEGKTPESRMTTASSPLTSTLIKTSPMVIGTLLGLRNPAAAVDETATTANAQRVAAAANQSQSMGAAGATTDISQLSAPVRSVIAATDPADIHQQALLNHIQAEKHGLVGDAALTKGQAQRDPVQFSEEQNRSTDPRLAARFANQNTAMVDNIDRIRREAAPTQVHNDVVANGRSVVDDLKAYDEPIKADISAKYKALADANGGTFPVGGKTLAANIDAALEKNNRQGLLPADIQRTVDGLRDGKQMTFDDFERLRSDLADATRSASNGREKNALNLTRQEVENLPLLPGAERLKGLADTARSAAKARFDELDRDPAYKAAVDDAESGNKRGEPTPLADKFIDSYALRAPKSQLDLMMGKLGEEGRGAVASHTLNTIKSGAVGKTGIVTPANFNTSIDRFDPKLDSLLKPETASDIREAAQVVQNVKAAPPGSSIAPKSGVLVRNALEAGAEHAANAATKGGYGVAKGLGFIKLPGSSKFINEALAPGAGIKK